MTDKLSIESNSRNSQGVLFLELMRDFLLDLKKHDKSIDESIDSLNIGIDILKKDEGGVKLMVANMTLKEFDVWIHDKTCKFSIVSLDGDSVLITKIR